MYPWPGTPEAWPLVRPSAPQPAELTGGTRPLRPNGVHPGKLLLPQRPLRPTRAGPFGGSRACGELAPPSADRRQPGAQWPADPSPVGISHGPTLRLFCYGPGPAGMGPTGRQGHLSWP